MKRPICTMLTLLSILGTVCAQHSVRATFGKPFGRSEERIERRFWIDLGKGNRLCLELEDARDLAKFTNIDSLLLVFIADMAPFNDSLTDPLSWHQIDYVTDAAGKKKVRLQTFHPTAASYLLDQAEPAALRLEQDTIQIVLEYPADEGRRHDGIRQDRLSLYLNDYHELPNYITGGLNGKIHWLQSNMKGYWVRDKNGYRAEKDPTISAPQPAGYVAMVNDYLGSVIQLNVGNYKNYFAPSFGLGIGLHFNGEYGSRSFTALWQPVFLFATNAQGHAQTYRNEFLTISISREWKDPMNKHIINLVPSLSIGRLIRRDGEFFEKNSYNLFIGHINLLRNNLVLTPGMYFHELFKEVTPAVNLKIDF
ncbi:hypothetical protein Q4E93_22520 [Flavitalea sp. BT771]|uniref:hypothetical protein n=1 Tax=Flavitalea sp. BT771 TaxID=3063329 RepID=UPI0026E19624|nr:hypothetical protein [Flavitalea sp. BT771]MDO6433404.1 hypothetical protein [Flavitalea sp. BT771]MDV6222691.1 hypothetical protein [Flavitalea sp. BT771]